MTLSNPARLVPTQEIKHYSNVPRLCYSPRPMSEAIAFDTHRFVKHLTENGFTEQQAEVLADEQVSLLNSNLATQADIAAIHQDIDALRQETKADIEVLRQETKANIATVRQEIEVLRQETKAGIDALRQETKAGIDALRQETKAGIDALRQETKADIDALRQETKADIDAPAPGDQDQHR